MKVIVQRIWNEPAVAIGLFTSLALLVGSLLTHDDTGSLEHIIAILAPLVSALGIRTQVKPARKEDHGDTP